MTASDRTVSAIQAMRAARSGAPWSLLVRLLPVAERASVPDVTGLVIGMDVEAARSQSHLLFPPLFLR